MIFDKMLIEEEPIVLRKGLEIIYEIKENIVFSGIYGAVCEITGKVYEGSSIDCVKRIDQHIKRLRKGTHSSPAFQAAFNFYGEECFTWYFLETVANEDCLLLVEQSWFDLTLPFARLKRGFNINESAMRPPSFKGKKRVKRTQEEKDRRAILLRGTEQPLKICDPQGKIHEFISSMADFAKINNLTAVGVQNLFCGKIKNHKGWTLPGYEENIKYHTIKNKSGEIFNFTSYKTFAEEHNLNVFSLSEVVRGLLLYHRGFCHPDTVWTDKQRSQKSFTVINPNGVVLTGKNYKEFSDNHNISEHNLYNLVSGWNKCVKGWTLENIPRISIFSPWGDEFYIFNQEKFAKENLLSHDLVNQLCNGKRQSLNGWSLSKPGLTLPKEMLSENYLFVMKNLVALNNSWALKQQ